MMEKTIFLEAEHIYLRPFQEEDAKFFEVWFNDKTTRAKIGETGCTSKEQAMKTVNRNSRDSIWLAIVRKEDDQVIGETGLLRIFPAWGTTDLTIIIPDDADQGKGYGKETINLMMDYAFGYLNLNRIAIGVVGFNENALRFYENVGFKQEGIQEQGYYYNYEYSDFIMMRILKKEFMELHHIKGS